MAVGIVFELCLAVPHRHQGADDPFGLAVGLGAVDLGEFLPDAVGLARLGEGMVVGAFIFFAVVGIGIVDLVRTLCQHLVDQELGGAVLGLVEQDVGVKLTGEVVYGDKQVLPRLGRRLAFEQRQALGVERGEFARIGFIVALGLAL